MEQRIYRRRGTPDFPMAFYWATAGKNMKPHCEAECHPDIEIAWVVSGTVTMQIGGVEKHFHQGDIFLIPPDAVHCRKGFSPDAATRTLVFSTDAIRLPPEHFFQKEFVQPLIDGRLDLPLVFRPDHPAYESIRNYMVQFERTSIRDKDYKSHRFPLLIGLCTALMPYCSLLSDSNIKQNPGNEVIRRCMYYLCTNYQKKLTLTDLSNHCHLNPSYLCTLFKQYVGETVFEYLTRIRIEQSVWLLQTTNLPINRIAENVGFHSECHFFKKFKEIMGMTPKVYAKSITEETQNSPGQ
ncbi:MAG: AraC family transcriptional regulator [Oscillospiraceae bacterium]|nr:AraC family transcriptional regulator [Oscillospiraceae bacterium]